MRPPPPRARREIYSLKCLKEAEQSIAVTSVLVELPLTETTISYFLV